MGLDLIAAKYKKEKGARLTYNLALSPRLRQTCIGLISDAMMIAS
jgi:hypothetical protein